MCSVHQGVFSTSGDAKNKLEGVQYIADIMMHVGNIMSTSGDVQYIGGIS